MPSLQAAPSLTDRLISEEEGTECSFQPTFTGCKPSLVCWTSPRERKVSWTSIPRAEEWNLWLYSSGGLQRGRGLLPQEVHSPAQRHSGCRGLAAQWRGLLEALQQSPSQNPSVVLRPSSPTRRTSAHRRTEGSGQSLSSRD